MELQVKFLAFASMAHNFFLIPAFIITVGLALVLTSIIATQGQFAKILLGNSFTTGTTLLISVLSLNPNNNFLLDIALIYATIGYISNLAARKFLNFPLYKL